MSAELGRENVHDLAPEEVARGLAEGTILLVDVREPNETEVERYPEAFYLPMSEFDPAAIPDPRAARSSSPAAPATARSPPRCWRRPRVFPTMPISPAASRPGRNSGCRPRASALCP